MIQTDETTKLGPAVVTAIENGQVVVNFEGASAKAINAIAFPWTPNVNDVALVIAQEGSHYIIGVLQTQGDFTMTFPANVNLRAPKGAINLHSGEGIDMHAPEVKVTAGKLTLLAKTMTEKFGNAFRWVSDLVQLKAGRSRSLVAGANYERSERRVIKAKKDVRINGDRIHLG